MLIYLDFDSTKEVIGAKKAIVQTMKRIHAHHCKYYQFHILKTSPNVLGDPSAFLFIECAYAPNFNYACVLKAENVKILYQL